MAKLSRASLSYFINLNFALVQSLCYFPNGNVASQDTPCRDDTPESTCCGQGYACLTNNMCMSTGDERQKEGATTFVRGSCTDKSWRSGSCPNFCADPNYDNTAGGNGVGQCPNSDVVFYCIDTLEVNCDEEENVLVFQDAPGIITTIGVEATSTSTSASTSAPTSTSTSTLTSISNGSESASDTISLTKQSSSTASSTAARTSSPGQANNSSRIAIGVGAGIGGLALISTVVAIACWRNKRRKRAKRAAYVTNTPLQAGLPGSGSMLATSEQQRWAPKSYPGEIYEAPGVQTSTRYELDSSVDRH